VLLIDNSNTVTKFILGDERKLLGGNEEVWRVPTAELREEHLVKVSQEWEFEAVCVSSVVPRVNEMLGVFFKELPFHSLSWESEFPVAIDYPKPEQIGADRLANAVAVFAKVGAPAIVIDFGTAVTFDVVDSEEGRAAYVGGVIAPGLAAMAHYLSDQTALLPEIEIAEPPSAIGKSTRHAMQVGAVTGYRGLVKEIVADLKKELHGEPTMVATGGHSELIAEKVSEIGEVDRMLTLEGIRLVALKNLSCF